MKNTTKKAKNIKSEMGIIRLLTIAITMPFYAVFLAYKFLIKFPLYRSVTSHILGLIRTLFWGYWFWVPDHELLFKNWFTNEQWQLSYWFFTLFTFIMTVISFFVFLGISKNGLDNLPVNDYPNESNIDYTIRQIDWKLSNTTERNKFIERLFKD